MIRMIMARATDGTIGHQGSLPWNLPSDLRRFAKLTKGQTLVMGRKTYESLPDHKLPNRNKLILTRDPNYTVDREDCRVYTDARDILHISEHHDLMVIGGVDIYKLFINFVDTIEMTEVMAEPDGDAKVTDLLEDGAFARVYDEYIDDNKPLVQSDKDQYAMMFVQYVRVHRVQPEQEQQMVWHMYGDNNGPTEETS